MEAEKVTEELEAMQLESGKSYVVRLKKKLDVKEMAAIHSGFKRFCDMTISGVRVELLCLPEHMDIEKKKKDAAERIRKHYRCYGYEKQNYLKEELDKIFDTKFNLYGEGDE